MAFEAEKVIRVDELGVEAIDGVKTGLDKVEPLVLSVAAFEAVMVTRVDERGVEALEAGLDVHDLGVLNEAVFGPDDQLLHVLVGKRPYEDTPYLS